LGGGKRVRPLLVYATGEALGFSIDSLDKPAVAIELMHAYSLVHDDLPCMDDDDLRRGKKTVHKEFDESTAVLSGDALQALSFNVLSHPHKDISPENQLSMLKLLAKASGFSGMVMGQAIDLAAVGQVLTEQQLEKMHRHKTGALINASVLQAADYKEGVHYKKLAPQPTETGNKIEVLEFFWYGCPHCYSFEPFIQSWKKSKPSLRIIHY